MSTQTLPRPARPFLPSDIKRDPPGRAFVRAAFAAAKNHCEGYRRGPEAYVEELWPHDRQALALTKAAANPAMTSVSGWASQLSPTATGEFVASLVGESAGARLIAAGLRVDLSGVSAVLIPHRTGNLPNVDTQWIGESNAFPVRQYSLTQAQLGPVHKLMTSTAATRELLEYASGEATLGQLMREDIGASLDAALFSNAAASSLRPAGLLFGVTPLTGTTDANEAALRGDIAKLATVASATGSANVAFIVSPGYALRLMTYKNVLEASEDSFQIWPSIAVPDGTIIAIATGAFVSGFGSVPRIMTSGDATPHMEDTTPLPIGTPGSPNVVAAPVRSLFQTDSIAIRCILDAAWVLRATGAAAWVQAVTW